MINDTQIRAARPRDKQYTLSDIRGLYLAVAPTGRKFFRFRYTRDGKRNWHTIGEYPMTTLAEARSRLPELRQRLKDGLPLVDEPEPDMSFRMFAETWAANHEMKLLREASKRQLRRNLNLHILPVFGDTDIRKITAADVLDFMQGYAGAGKHATMNVVKVTISHIFRYAIAAGAVQYDPTTALRNVVSIPPTAHHPTFREHEEIKRLLLAVNGYSNPKLRENTQRTRLAATFMIYSFCRPSEVCGAMWKEIDMNRVEWRLPAERMKMKRPHIVPLSRQLLEILEAMRPISGHGEYIFPDYMHVIRSDKPMCTSTINRMIRTLGFSKEEICPHGFRGMASTILNENGFNSDWIERQLAHSDRNRVRESYNHADYLDDRRRMVQWYGDYLDELRGEPLNLA